MPPASELVFLIESRPTRDAWIETSRLPHQMLPEQSRPTRDAWIETHFQSRRKKKKKSRPTRDAWIETPVPAIDTAHAPKSRCVHLATHGFFSDPSAESALSIEMIKKAFFDDAEKVEMKPQVAKGYNPGLLSGIVFAGANRTRAKLAAVAGAANTAADIHDGADIDDGIVTAEEIALMQLGNVRLAVLSACETGLGEVAGGEGMLGLQRAFQIAGARTTVSSLWAVNDRATSWLMQEFYRNQLEPDRRMPVLDALREAQLAVMRSETAAQKEFASQNNITPPPRLSPEYWAPFVLAGDWR